MRRIMPGLMTLFLGTAVALAAPADRWLHVQVDETGKNGERVRVNLPLELAEKVLPAIHTGKLRDGKVKVSEAKIDEVDLRALLDAVRTTKDNEFVTVESNHENVRVAKAGGHLLIKVREGKDKANTVDVSIPFPVIEALLSGGKDELDILAAVRALSAVGDTVLVTVKDESSNVRIWVDSKNTME